MVLKQLSFPDRMKFFSVARKFKDIMERNPNALIKDMPDKIELNMYGFSTAVIRDFFKTFGPKMKHLSLMCRGIEKKMLDLLICSISDHCKSLQYIRFRYAPFENADEVRKMQQQLKQIDRNIDIGIFPYHYKLYLK